LIGGEVKFTFEKRRGDREVTAVDVVNEDGKRKQKKQSDTSSGDRFVIALYDLHNC
jgi:hypothetical protein